MTLPELVLALKGRSKAQLGGRNSLPLFCGASRCACGLPATAGDTVGQCLGSSVSTLGGLLVFSLEEKTASLSGNAMQTIECSRQVINVVTERAACSKPAMCCRLNGAVCHCCQCASSW